MKLITNGLGRRSALLACAMAAVAATTAYTLHTTDASAATHTNPNRHRTSGERSEQSEAQKLPAPPRPSQTRPAERAVTDPSGSTKRRGPSRTYTTASSLDQVAVTTTSLEQSVVTASALDQTAVGAVTSSGTGVGTAKAKALVLYDSTGDYGWLGEAYATMASNLTSHFGTWTAHPVAKYTAGELSGYTSVIYIGSTYDEPIPVAFLDDVLATSVPVVWCYDNIWQLTARQSDFATRRGFTYKQFDFASVAAVTYHGTSLTRDTVNGAGIMDLTVGDQSKASVLATATRADGTTMPWATRSGNLTYVGEIPFAYMTHDDRYLAFADLLYDALAPTAGSRHRALVRIEDVGPDSDPAELKAVTDYLYSKKVPFTAAVYSKYRDPKGVNNGGKATEYTLRQKPEVVSALKYMTSHGGTLLMHGYTHQYESVANPYDAVSGNDFEFYAAHVDAANNVVYDGPVAKDSALWATSRVTAASTDFLLAGLAKPTMFEFPHYAASATDYATIGKLFTVRYDRGLYFGGALSGTTPNYGHMVGQFFPYTVRDVYGTTVVPENLGNVEPEAYNNHPPRLPADILASAKRNLVIRDGVASFFYHPYLGTAYLKTVVEGVTGLGYTFTTASAMTTG